MGRMETGSHSSSRVTWTDQNDTRDRNDATPHHIGLYNQAEYISGKAPAPERHAQSQGQQNICKYHKKAAVHPIPPFRKMPMPWPAALIPASAVPLYFYYYTMEMRGLWMSAAARFQGARKPGAWSRKALKKECEKMSILSSHPF